MEPNGNIKSKGLGDSISKVTHALKLDKVANYIAKLAGAEGCGCDERQEYLNKLFPYDKSFRSFKALKDFSDYDVHYKKDQVYKISKNDMIHRNIFEHVRDEDFEEII